MLSTLDPAGTEELRSKVSNHYWYHRIELPCGVVTAGVNPLDINCYRIPDLTGKRVLDVGAWDGFWTFEALKRGARQAVAIDDFSDLMGMAELTDRRSWATFDLCREALGYDEDRCQRREMNVYDISEANLGRFDVIFFFGTLYHLRHPLLAIDRLASICDDQLLVESFICDGFSPYRGGAGKGYDRNEMLMEFYPDAQLSSNATNWFGPTLTCLAHMIRSAGFRQINGWRLMENPPSAGFSRGFVHAFKQAAKPQEADPQRAST